MPDDTTRTRHAGLPGTSAESAGQTPGPSSASRGVGTEDSAREAPTTNDGGGESHPSRLPTTPSEPAEPTAQPRTSAQRPLITSIEIENFKGIGRPVRIDLRPITLLFGRNSAGKSTILHALCYAHEILTHGNIDAQLLELGGDQIDLGGFRRFVHRHALDRVFRIRIALNLHGWNVPDRLVRQIIDSDTSAAIDEAVGALAEEWVEARAPSDFARSAWVALTVGWHQAAGGPTLDTYEVGVNGSLVGRLERDRQASVAPTRLAYNVAHPLFDSLQRNDEQPTQKTAARATTSTNADGHETQLAHAAVLNLPSPLPNWTKLLDLWGADRIKEGEDRDVFQARISSMLVGVGDALRTELATVRYIGPVRRLRPPTSKQTSMSNLRGWSDGSEAWRRLLRDDKPASDTRELVDEVNAWLARQDRLDAGYKLRRRSTVELPADDSPVALIRFLDSLPATFRNQTGDLDLESWPSRAASEIAALSGDDPRMVEARIKECSGGERQGTDLKHQDGEQEPAETQLIEAYRKRYQLASACMAYRKKLEKGGPPLEDLVRPNRRRPTSDDTGTRYRQLRPTSADIRHRRGYLAAPARRRRGA